MARGISFTLFIAAALAACVGDDPNTSGTTPAADGGTSSSGGPVGQSLLDNGGFENGCSGFTSSNAELTPETVTIRNGKACRVCKIPGDEGGYYIYGFVDAQPKPGEVYTVSAWMRKAPGVDTGGGTTLMALVGMDNSGSPTEPVVGASQPGPLVNEEWKEGTVTWNVDTDAASRMRVDIGFQGGAAGNCFIIDDLSVTKK